MSRGRPEAVAGAIAAIHFPAQLWYHLSQSLLGFNYDNIVYLAVLASYVVTTPMTWLIRSCPTTLYASTRAAYRDSQYITTTMAILFMMHHKG